MDCLSFLEFLAQKEQYSLDVVFFFFFCLVMGSLAGKGFLSLNSYCEWEKLELKTQCSSVQKKKPPESLLI